MKIKRVDALIQVTNAIEENDYDRANKILQIIDRSIQSDKARNVYSTEIEIHKDEKKYFVFQEEDK